MPLFSRNCRGVIKIYIRSATEDVSNEFVEKYEPILEKQLAESGKVAPLLKAFADPPQGRKFSTEAKKYIQTADLILLLVNDAFLNSASINDEEIPFIRDLTVTKKRKYQ